jgi:hypothetical protein
MALPLKCMITLDIADASIETLGDFGGHLQGSSVWPNGSLRIEIKICFDWKVSWLRFWTT